MSAQIYLNEKFLESRDLTESAHERIGSLCHRAVEVLDQTFSNKKNFKTATNIPGSIEEKLKPILKELGVHADDIKAQSCFADFFNELKRGKIKVVPTTDTEGMFFLEVDGERKWVFKPGEKRAYIETLARRIMVLIGLEEFLPECMCCSLKVEFPPKASDGFEESSSKEKEPFHPCGSNRFSSSDFESMTSENLESSEEDLSDTSSMPDGDQNDSFPQDFFNVGLNANFDFTGSIKNIAANIQKKHFSDEESVFSGSEIDNSSSDFNQKEIPIRIELFNGLVKQIFPQGQSGFLTGILETFEKTKEAMPEALADFSFLNKAIEKHNIKDPVKLALMLYVMSILGMGDIKGDNVTSQGVFLDWEDSLRLVGKRELDNTALFQLSFLVHGSDANPALYSQINPGKLTIKDVGFVDLVNLMQEEILFFDATAEKELKLFLTNPEGLKEEIKVEVNEDLSLSFKAEKEEFNMALETIVFGDDGALPEGWEFAVSGIDSGGFESILEIPMKHLISGYMSYWTKENKDHLKMPIPIINEVIGRKVAIENILKRAVKEKRKITPLEIVEAADPNFKWQCETSPEFFEQKLNEKDFIELYLKNYPNKQEKDAFAAYGRYKRNSSATPLVWIGREPSGSIGLKSPSPSVNLFSQPPNLNLDHEKYPLEVKTREDVLVPFPQRHRGYFDMK